MNKIKSNRNSFIATSLAAYTMLSAAAVNAQSTDERATEFQLRAGYGYSDNILRANPNEIESGFAIVGLTVDVDIERPRITFEALGDIDYIFYEDSAIRNRPDGDLDATLTTILFPERLRWYVDGTYSQIRQTPSLGDTPDNLSEFLLIRTGLTGDIPLGQRTSLNIDVAAGDRQFMDIQDLDGQELTAALGLFRQLRPRSSLGVLASISSIEYDDSVDTEYDIERIFVRYQSTLASGEFIVDAGLNKLSDDFAGTSSSSEPLFGLTWARDVGRRSRVTLNASHRLVDLGSSVAPGNTSGQGATRAGRLTPTQSPFKETQFSVNYSATWERTRLGTGLDLAQQRYEEQVDQNVDIAAFNMFWRRSFSQTFSTVISGSIAKRKEIRALTEGRDLTVALTLSKAFSRKLNLNFNFIHRKRDSNNGSNYSEDQVRLDLSYGRIGS